MTQKTIGLINAMMPEKAARIHRDIQNACKPFVDELVRLYSFASPSALVSQDGRIELVDPYERLPQELQKTVDSLQECMRMAEESVLRGHGIELKSQD